MIHFDAQSSWIFISHTNQTQLLFRQKHAACLRSVLSSREFQIAKREDRKQYVTIDGCVRWGLPVIGIAPCTLDTKLADTVHELAALLDNLEGSRHSNDKGSPLTEISGNIGHSAETVLWLSGNATSDLQSESSRFFCVKIASMPYLKLAMATCRILHVRRVRYLTSGRIKDAIFNFWLTAKRVCTFQWSCSFQETGPESFLQEIPSPVDMIQ